MTLVSRAAKQILWMFSEMEEVGYPQEKPGVLYNDNTGAVALTKNTKHNSCVKHIDIRHHFIHECVENKNISVDRFVLSLSLETNHFRTFIIHNPSQSCTKHQPKSAECTDHSLKPTDIRRFH